MVRHGKWRKWTQDDVTLRMLDALTRAAEQDKTLGFNELTNEAKISKKTTSRYLPTLLNKRLVTFMMIGKRKQYYVLEKGIFVKKALDHEHEWKKTFTGLNLILLPGLVLNTNATVAVHNLDEQKKKMVETLTADYMKKLKETVGNSTTRVMLSINYLLETSKQEQK